MTARTPPLTSHLTPHTSIESRSGLDPWRMAELPEPPRPRGFQWISTVGPGVIVLGASIGSGEYLLRPAAFVRYGLTPLGLGGGRDVPRLRGDPARGTRIERTLEVLNWLLIAAILGSFVVLAVIFVAPATWIAEVTGFGGLWGVVALHLTRPDWLLQIAANAASAIFVIAGLHLLYVNTRLLPRELRPGLWPRLGLVGLVVFYALFSYLSFRELVS